jgi:P-type Na+/K+ transporter
MINIVVGLFYSYKAERAIQGLRKLSSSKATVIRHNAQQTKYSEVPTSDVVVGDIVMLRAGQVVPGDLRLFQTFDLRINESILTGECLAVLKTEEILPEQDDAHLQLGNYINIAYSGTMVTKGEGYGIVYATGLSTQIGKIAESLRTSRSAHDGDTSSSGRSKRCRIKFPMKRVLGLRNSSPLQKRHVLHSFNNDRLAILAYFLCLTSLILVMVVFGISQFKISEEIALYAVALALAMIPESLLAIVTITLAKGVSHMHQRHALVRHLDAIETIGGIHDICLDKTGTLTTGNMEVRKVWNGSTMWHCESADLSLSQLVMERVTGERGDLIELIRCASLCNDAMVKQGADKWHAHGDPTEVSNFSSFLISDRSTGLRREGALSQVFNGGIFQRP